MFSAARLHAIYKIANAQVRHYPFAHIYVPEIFPESFYREMRRNLPPNDGYIELRSTGRVGTGYSAARLSLFPADLGKANLTPAQRDFWRQAFDMVGNEEFGAAIFNCFRSQIEDRFAGKTGQRVALDVYHETFLMRDLDTYSLGPHTDNPTKIVSVLMYMPGDASSSELGTALYIPKDRSFVSEGGPHLEFDLFDHVYTAPYLPNTLVAFPKTMACFHGVEPVKGPSKQMP
jgi:hypothetical protein